MPKLTMIDTKKIQKLCLTTLLTCGRLVMNWCILALLAAPMTSSMVTSLLLSPYWMLAARDLNSCWSNLYKCYIPCILLSTCKTSPTLPVSC